MTQPPRRIADLHCHFPMHLLDAPAAITGQFRARLVHRAARLLNFRTGDSTWRVSLDGLREANTGLVLSVLYDPASELLRLKGRPRKRSFAALVHQLDAVEAELKRVDPDRQQYVVVTTEVELDAAVKAGTMAFVHCVEGGFHLGWSTRRIKRRVKQLRKRGVAYITLAHLFYRGFANNVPAFPAAWGSWIDRIFPQRGNGLTKQGRAAIAAMYDERILVDICHMRADAIQQTFELLAELDKKHGRLPGEYPVIASHAGVRHCNRTYMLDEETITGIKEREGVIGLILARDDLQDGLPNADSSANTIAVVERHISDLHAITGSHDHTGIGSDLDGFTKPTMSGIESSQDLEMLVQCLHERHGSDADKILFGNALRVVRKALTAWPPPSS